MIPWGGEPILQTTSALLAMRLKVNKALYTLEGTSYLPNVMGSGIKACIIIASSFRLSTLPVPDARQAGCGHVKDVIEDLHS